MATRRTVLATLAAGAGLAALGLPRLSFAAAPGDRRFVFVLLRGGLDGLAAVPPIGDRRYAERRGNLALAPSSCGRLDGTFGLNPALAPLLPYWPKGELAFVHGAGAGYRTRSHFDAQDLLESGLATKQGMSDGWLNRALGVLQGGDARLGLAVGGAVPLIMRGAVRVATWEPPGLKSAAPEFLASLTRLYAADPLFGPALAEGLKAQNFSTEVLGDGMKRGPRGFGPNSFRPLAEAAGRLLAAADGPRVAVLEMGGWDTHAGQGTEAGRLAQNLAGLADGIDGLVQALGPAWRTTVLAAETEFGRTVAPNGTGGTDHGTGSAMLLMGGALRGGRMVGDWPGLDQLEDNRDLRAVNDTRGVLKGILRDHLGIEAATLERKIFPGTAGLRPLDRLLRA